MSVDAGRALRTLRIALVVLLFFAATGCSLLPEASPDQASRDALLADYLAALERRDGAAIAAMVEPGVDAGDAIVQVLGHVGGVVLHSTQAEWVDATADGRVVTALVSGVGDDGATYQLEVPIVWKQGRLFLGLGRERPHPPGGTR